MILPRLLATNEAEAAGGLLGRTFIDDPGAAIIEPDPSRRRAVNAGLFALDLRVSIGQAWVTFDDEGMAGVGVWTPPGAADVRLDEAARREASAVAGDDATLRWLALLDDFEHVRQHAMPEPHWFLALLGVDPRAQGRGIGNVLIQVGHDAADRAGLPCFLETFTAQNVAYYERRGYRLRYSTMIADGVPLHAMARPPRSGP